MVAPFVIGLIGGGIGGLAGFVAGALSRQPEINELKKQVRALQDEIERLHNVIKIQDSQIRELQIRYSALKGWQFIEKSRQRKYLRGCLVYKYALREYLSILIDADSTNKVRMNKEEVQFYNAFGKALNDREITEKDRSVVFDYIDAKYGDEIKAFKEPDISPILEYLS